MDEEGYKWQLRRLILPAPNGKSYDFLIEILNYMIFIPKIERDENRAADGLMLREKLGWYDDRPCSVLEMLIALAGRFDGNSGFDSSQARYNFWIMIENLCLDRYDDDKCHKDCYGKITIEMVIKRFIDRTYQFDGFGGLFPLKKAKNDQRKTEIWDQMQAWEIENYGV